MKGLSIVLPCYNEGESLPAIVESYRQALTESGLKNFELILVNNGSTDHSVRVLSALKKKKGNSFVRVVTIPQNRGYGHGVLTGLETARFDHIGFSHADGQCEAGNVFRAYAALKDSRSLAKGVRYGRALGSFLFSRVFELIALVLRRRFLYEVNAQPKVFPKELLDAIREEAPIDFAFDLHVLLRAAEAGYRFETIAVRFPPRLRGSSRWSATFRSRWKHSWALIGFMRRYRPYSPPEIFSNRRVKNA